MMGQTDTHIEKLATTSIVIELMDNKMIQPHIILIVLTDMVALFGMAITFVVESR
jgi:hypothetical protein